ncbi:MAG: hypothetical protein SFV15_08495 [Polyangiaceae bacterium]|nr:hypothetical protein [Polyangiaceae bacterium]
MESTQLLELQLVASPPRFTLAEMNVFGWCWVLVPVALLACAGESQDKPLTRSPSLDYRTDQPRTADGRPIGADGIDPKDRLAASAKAGENGGELAPGWYVEDGKLKYDPERRTDPQGKPKAKKPKPEPDPKTPPP